MLLTVDVGNTNIVLGLFDGDEITQSYRMRTDARVTADELGLVFNGLLSRHVHPDGIAVCSTVPQVLDQLQLMFARYYADAHTVVVGPGVKTGVPLLYDNPKELGSDRIVNALAAYHRYGGPSIVVDFGTSTNFDIVSAKGEFVGGVLAPGIEISIDALASRAARLLKVELTRPRAVIGKSTVEALQSGILYGFAGQIDGLVRRIEAELGAPATVIATGGLAQVVIAESETIQHYEPDLTLVGLRLVYERNT